jgi:hypothetical protein
MCCGGRRTVMQPSGTYRTDTDTNVAGVSLAQFGAGSSFFEHLGAGISSSMGHDPVSNIASPDRALSLLWILWTAPHSCKCHISGSCRRGSGERVMCA